MKGDIGIVFAEESELFNYVQQGSTNHYAQSARGAYQAFFDSNIQADWVHIDNIGEYKAVYLPYPVMLKAASAKKLIAYVEQGGNLISEGLPAYFGDGGKVGTSQPNYGLDRLFGAKESYVEFTPDLLDNLKVNVRKTEIHGRYFLQEYELAGGTAVGRYENGHIAAVENRYGKGRALLIGTFPGAGYYLHHGPAGQVFFSELLNWAGVTQQVRSSDQDVKARLHDGPGGTYLWVVNTTREPRRVTVTLHSPVKEAKDLRSAQVEVQGKDLRVSVDQRDAAVIRLVR